MLIELLYKNGLGDLLISHEIDGAPRLCNIAYDAGKLVLREQSYFKLNTGKGLSGIRNEPLGVLTKAENEEWKGMTFLGISHCNFNIQSSMDYVKKIMTIENQYGDKLADFRGSIYRAYQLALDNDILPIVSMHTNRTKNGKYGMTVYNFPVEGCTTAERSNLFHVLRKAVEKKLTYSLDELNLPDDSFANLFGKYVNNGS